LRGDVLMERGSTEVVTFRNAAQTVARTLLKPFFKETVMLLLPRALYCLIALAIGAAVTAPARSQAAHLAHPSSMPASPKPPSKQVLALFDAAERGATPKVKALLDKGVSAKVQAPNGLTPLILASMMNHPDTVKLLLDRGADVNAALRPGGYIGGSTPLIMAASGFTNILAGAKTPPAPPGYEGHEIEFMKKHPGFGRPGDRQAAAGQRRTPGPADLQQGLSKREASGKHERLRGADGGHLDGPAQPRADQAPARARGEAERRVVERPDAARQGRAGR